MATLGMQIQVRQWRALVWVATLGLAALAGRNLWTIIKAQRANAYVPRDIDAFGAVIRDAAGNLDAKEVKPAAWQEYSHLIGAALNGFVPKEAEKPVETKPTTPELPPEKPITDVLKVTMITSAGDAGCVFVKYKDDTVKPFTDESALKVGAVLVEPYNQEPYNGRLKAVHPGVAVFDWCGKDVEVRPLRKEEEKSKGPEAAGDSAPARATASSNLSGDEQKAIDGYRNSKVTVKLPNDAGFVLGSEEIEEARRSAGDSYIKSARLEDKPRSDGKGKEIVVGNISPRNKLSQTYGVQTGDVLVSINGVEMSTKTEAYEYVRNNSDLEKYVVVTRRKGKDISTTILVPRNKK